MLLVVMEYLDLLSISELAKGIGSCEGIIRFNEALQLLKVVHINDLRCFTENWIFGMVPNIEEIHFHSLMNVLCTLPSLVMSNNGGIITPGYACSAIVQFIMQFPLCKVVIFWSSRNLLEPDHHAVNECYVGALMDEFSLAYRGNRIDSSVTILGLKCPLSSLPYEKRYRIDDIRASQNCNHCKLACRYWPISEVLKFRSNYHAHRMFRGGNAFIDEPMDSVSPEPSYLDVCQDYYDIQQALDNRRSDGYVFDTNTRLINIMKGCKIHKFRSCVFPGEVICILTMNESQISWINRVLRETKYDTGNLEHDDVKKALKGPLLIGTSPHERWYVRSADRMQEEFGIILDKDDWPHHFMPAERYTHLEAMTLGIMYNLRDHIPHLAETKGVTDFHRSWVHSIKMYSYEEMLGLGFHFSAKKSNGLLDKGRNYIVFYDNTEGNNIDGHEMGIRVEEIDKSIEKGTNDYSKTTIRIGSQREGLSLTIACDFFPSEVTDLMKDNQRVVQLK